jgi:hypothetical protein
LVPERFRKRIIGAAGSFAILSGIKRVNGRALHASSAKRPIAQAESPQLRKKNDSLDNIDYRSSHDARRSEATILFCSLPHFCRNDRQEDVLRVQAAYANRVVWRSGGKSVKAVYAAHENDSPKENHKDSLSIDGFYSNRCSRQDFSSESKSRVFADSETGIFPGIDFSMRTQLK